MPADTSLSSEPSQHHGDGNAPYPCHSAKTPPGAAWGIDYGWCRTSLDWHGPDSPQGAGDPRCPATCQHKAPAEAAIEFGERFVTVGAVKAAEWTREKRNEYSG